MKRPLLSWLALAFCAALMLVVGPAHAQVPGQPPGTPNAEGLVNLDFDDVELTVVIDTIARVTGKNFIYDDRVRGRVTILSPQAVTIEQAYAVFESVLRVKGFTAVPGPANVMKIIPIRDAKESNIETVKDGRPSVNRDLYVTRLIPLLYIDATEITNTIKPLVSKDASIVAYAPTNMIILTDAASNIRRLLSILESIDVKTHKEELAVIKIEYADADTLGQQVSEIYGAEVTSSSSRPAARSSSRRTTSSRTTTASSAGAATSASRGSRVRIITDERTNSLLVLAARSQLEDIRQLVRQLDVPVIGQGRIHVYYLKHSDAEEISQTLNGLLSGQPRSAGTTGRAAGGSGAQPQTLRSTVTELGQSINITADPATNSLVIQASKEAYATLIEVIEQLDIPRPQVLVEALIMEVDVTDEMILGVDATYKVVSGDMTWVINTGSAVASIMSTQGAGAAPGVANVFSGLVTEDDGTVSGDQDGTEINAIITAAAKDNRFNILSAPHVLTMDNEEAEIKVGDNIPIVTSRIQSAAGVETGLSTSQNIERQDIGVNLRVTPQISEGDTLRLKIFQEIKEVNEDLDQFTATESGVALRQRVIENTVVVHDGETIVIGGLISEVTEDNQAKVPFLGDLPVFGFAFRTDQDKLRKTNLLVFLTPHIIRTEEDLIGETIRKRRELIEKTREDKIKTVEELMAEAPRTSVHAELREHAERYPIEQLDEIEANRAARREAREAALAGHTQERNYEVIADVFRDEEAASRELLRLIDAGFDAALVSASADGMLVFELRVGPFESLENAELVAGVLRDSYDFTPSLTVLTPAPAPTTGAERP